MPASQKDLDPKAWQSNEKDLALRKELEERIRSRLISGIERTTRDHALFDAVDLAWDSEPITKMRLPLMLYAQGRLDSRACAQLISKACGPNSIANEFITRNDAGLPESINVPKFVDVTVNLVRSVITRRWSAQDAKYSNLYPIYKYEARGTRPADLLYADVISQVIDTKSDHYGWRHSESQMIRDMFLYPYTVEFLECAWEKEWQWNLEDVATELSDSDQVSFKQMLVREGPKLFKPHPSRVSWDDTYSIATLNTDTGIRWIQYWDLTTYETLLYGETWNKDAINWSDRTLGLLSACPEYTNQHFGVIKLPVIEGQQVTEHQVSISTEMGIGVKNDLKANAGLYSMEQRDRTVIVTHYYEKISPVEVGVGDYPFPVWFHYMVAGDGTVIWAEILPSRPGNVIQYNQKDDRRLSLSMAHEVLAYQDHLTNLMSFLLLCIKSENIRVLVLDIDGFIDDKGGVNKEALNQARSQLQGASSSGKPIVLEISRSKMRDIGVDISHVVQMVETRQPQTVQVIVQAIAQILSMIDRLLAMSPQENGQPAPREISATETNLLANTTDSVYTAISAAVDEFRSARKEMFYRLFLACAEDTIYTPVLTQYPQSTVLSAGFEPVDGAVDAQGMAKMVTGPKSRLPLECIFTSRDGAQRNSNAANAQALTQLLQTLSQFVQFGVLTKDSLYEIINRIGRAVGEDMNLERAEGDSNELLPSLEQQYQQALQQIVEKVDQLSQGMVNQGQAIMEIRSVVQQIIHGTTTEINQPQ